MAEEEVLFAKQLLSYQPFIISDNVQVGVGYQWRYGEDVPLVMEKEHCTEKEWLEFTEANARLRECYDNWVDATCAVVGDLRHLSVVDTACNSGYFLYRFWEKGIRKCVGYDRGNFGLCVDFMNRITGYKFRFVHEPYNPLTHRIQGCGKYDIVVSTVVMNHLSDPLNYISFLGSITRKALLLVTLVSEEDARSISYGRPNLHYKKDPFPVCFDNTVIISRGLLCESLRLAGFRDIRFIPSGVPDEWCAHHHLYKPLVALKGESIPDPMKVWNKGSRYTEARSELLRKVGSVLGYRRLFRLMGFVQSRPRLRSFLKRVI